MPLEIKRREPKLLYFGKPPPHLITSYSETHRTHQTASIVYRSLIRTIHIPYHPSPTAKENEIKYQRPVRDY